MEKKGYIKEIWNNFRTWMAGLSFRTGVIILSLCVPCYIFAFVQTAFPISFIWKGTLWTIFFGLAKTFQYGGLLILGKEGWIRLKTYFRRKKEAET